MTENRHADDYYRRRIDDITDNRLEALEARLTKIEGRINYLFGVLGLLVVLANLIAPLVIHAVTSP